MKAVSAQSISGISVTFKPTVLVLGLLLVFFMAALIVVRQQCIHEGYKISVLTVTMDKKNIEYEQLSAEYSKILRRESLINKAVDMGFTFPVGDRVFYVKP
ncbi:MAG: hypothetical protein IJD28_01005 [Deferribacterales bacterium]|nr:hypothetical protein [Deferribacterales bacterium]